MRFIELNKNYLCFLYRNDPISVTRFFYVVDLFMYNAYLLLALNAFSKESMHYHLLIFMYAIEKCIVK